MSDYKWTSDPHVNGYWWEPHVLTDITGKIIHVRHAVIDRYGRIVDRRDSGEVDELYDCNNRPIAEEYHEWLGSAFLDFEDQENFEMYDGDGPVWDGVRN